MKHLLKIIQKAKHSSFYLWVLNRTLLKVVPFNKPHGFKILNISDHSITIELCYQNSNLNHIKGMHACALATLAEYTTGFLLLSRLDPAKHRVIIQSIDMVYHYQCKMNAVAQLTINEDWLNQHVYLPLQTQETIIVPFEIDIHDTEKNHLCTGKINWQVKNWDKVKTRID